MSAEVWRCGDCGQILSPDLFCGCRDIDETIVEWPTEVPGLLLREAESARGTRYFVYIHMRSRRAVASWPTKSQALDALYDLAACGDWDRSGAELRADDDLIRRKDEVLHAHGATTRFAGSRPERVPS